MEVSDGVIAPGYTDEALAILKTKKKGNYNVVQIDPDYEPSPIELRHIYGITFQQGYNNFEINEALLDNIVTRNKELPQQAKHDLLLALLTLKYTQSNSVCYVKNGQTIGVGAGQQKPHPLHPAGGQQGGQLDAAPAPQGTGPAVCGRHPPAQPGQRHRRVFYSPTSGRTCWPTACGSRPSRSAPSPSPGRRKGLDRHHEGRVPWAPTPSSPSGTTWSGPGSPACSISPSPAAPSVTTTSSRRRISTAW